VGEGPIERLLAALQREDWRTIKRAIQAVETAGLWLEAARGISEMGPVPTLIRSEFHVLWTERGHHMRAFIDEDSVLIAALRVLLPSYDGSTQVLYRGESLARARLRQYGTGWTTKIETARMFASGLNAVEPDGGVLLRAYVPKEDIIAGPSDHSRHLTEEEYVIDPRQLVVSQVEIFSPLLGNTSFKPQILELIPEDLKFKSSNYLRDIEFIYPRQKPSKP